MIPFDFDIDWLLALNFDGGRVVDFLMYGVSWKFTWVPLYIGVLWWIWLRKGWQTALLFLLAAVLMILCADQTATFFKSYLPKLRPSHNPDIQHIVHTVYHYRGGLYGTVSSHAANSIAFAIISSFVIRKRTYTWLMAAWVIVTCYSRIYLGVHYPMDIILGVVDGTIWALVWVWVMKYAKQRLKI